MHLVLKERDESKHFYIIEVTNNETIGVEFRNQNDAITFLKTIKEIQTRNTRLIQIERLSTDLEKDHYATTFLKTINSIQTKNPSSIQTETLSSENEDNEYYPATTKGSFDIKDITNDHLINGLNKIPTPESSCLKIDAFTVKTGKEVNEPLMEYDPRENTVNPLCVATDIEDFSSGRAQTKLRSQSEESVKASIHKNTAQGDETSSNAINTSRALKMHDGQQDAFVATARGKNCDVNLTQENHINEKGSNTLLHTPCNDLASNETNQTILDSSLQPSRTSSTVWKMEEENCFEGQIKENIINKNDSTILLETPTVNGISNEPKQVVLEPCSLVLTAASDEVIQSYSIKKRLVRRGTISKFDIAAPMPSSMIHIAGIRQHGNNGRKPIDIEIARRELLKVAGLNEDDFSSPEKLEQLNKFCESNNVLQSIDGYIEKHSMLPSSVGEQIKSVIWYCWDVSKVIDEKTKKYRMDCVSCVKKYKEKRKLRKKSVPCRPQSRQNGLGSGVTAKQVPKHEETSRAPENVKQAKSPHLDKDCNTNHSEASAVYQTSITPGLEQVDFPHGTLQGGNVPPPPPPPPAFQTEPPSEPGRVNGGLKPPKTYKNMVKKEEDTSMVGLLHKALDVIQEANQSNDDFNDDDDGDWDNWSDGE